MSPSGTTSSWAPLRHGVFRALWIAAVVSNIGSWMHEVGAAWLMTSLAPSPFMVALITTAESVPIFLFALFAGALADIFDRRRILVATQGWMLLSAGALGIITLLGFTTPWMLLAMTVAMSIGAAMSGPAWQALMPELVGRNELPQAIALNGVSFNIARSIGPALGGLVVAASGPAGVFILNAVSFLGIVIVIARMKRPVVKRVIPSEQIYGAMRAGMRYTRHSPALRGVLVRSGVFIIGGSAIWALLPLYARQQLGLSSIGFGVLLGCFGIGAIGAAFLMQSMRRSRSVDRLLAETTLVFAVVYVVLALVHTEAIILPVMVIAGGAWMLLMSSYNVMAQFAVPAWVRARAMAVYQLVFWVGMAGGSLMWGLIAERYGIPTTFLVAAVGVIVGLLATRRYRLSVIETLDLTPSTHWDDPIVEIDAEPEEGPVLVTVEYHIDPDQDAPFMQAINALSVVRRRDGAIQWGIYRDTSEPGRYLETWIVESWAEHLRQHDRVTVADKALEEAVHAFHNGASPPAVEHYIHGKVE
jgi:MFS family permease